MTRPYVILHVAIGLDGATTGFEPDVARFYELARTWDEDVTLVGADTILAQEAALAGAPRPGPTPGAPLLAVVDARRRVREWAALRDCGHWSGVVALRARGAGETSRRRADARLRIADRDRLPEEIAVGDDRVDLAAALHVLGERCGARVVRVDSGGTLNGALLRGGLVDEVSLVVHPVVSGGGLRWHGSDPPRLRLERLACTPLPDGLVWLRYRALLADRGDETPADRGDETPADGGHETPADGDD